MKSTFESWLKFILFGCLVGVGISACSDDALEGGENPDVQGDNTPAYLTVSFSTAGNSSRSTADDANNTGDKDGDAEDSGHSNVGTDNENAINSALIVVKSVERADGFAKLYSNVDTDLEALTATTDKIYKTVKPIKLKTGNYDVLVVANPYIDLYSAYNEDNKLSTDGITTDVAELYENILDGNYEYKLAENETPSQYNYGGDIVKIENGTEVNSSELKGIMMANKKNAPVTIKAEHQVGNPQTVEVEIERVASKITFRHKMWSETEQKMVDAEDYNAEKIDYYPVKVTLPKKLEPVTVSYTYTEPEAEGGNDVSVTLTLNKATYVDEEGNENLVYVHVDDDGVKTYYTGGTESNGVVTEVIKDTNTKYTVENVNIHYKEESISQETWYVKLEKYALVNLAKKVYHVRHIINNPAEEDGVPFGTLNGNNYLYTPYWPGINKIDLSSGSWSAPDFFNKLENVSEDSKKESDWTYFKNFASNPEGTDDKQDVTGDGNKNQHTTPLSPIGDLLAYCLENSTDIEHQTHGLSTGIAFQARIYDSEKKDITALYRYAGHLFESIEAIQNAYGKPYDENATEGLESLTENSKADDLAEVGVVKYASNICYYYSTEIKHFDNNDNEKLGNMEFAIMRNNIYSLAVTGINVIGDPWVDPTPGTENEIKETYLTVEAKIMPWIVRYHDIEFE